jgi:hypothetical protein
MLLNPAIFNGMNLPQYLPFRLSFRFSLFVCEQDNHLGPRVWYLRSILTKVQTGILTKKAVTYIGVSYRSFSPSGSFLQREAQHPETGAVQFCLLRMSLREPNRASCTPLDISI